MVAVHIVDEIPLSEWAEENRIPLRTAQSWARTGKIKAKKKKMAINVVTTRLVETYMVRENTKKPE